MPLLALLFAPMILGPTGPIENPSPEVVARFQEIEQRTQGFREQWWADLDTLAASNEGTRHLAAAMRGTWDIIDDTHLFLGFGTIAAEGWSDSSPEFAAALTSHSEALSEAVAASQAESIALPNHTDNMDENHVYTEWSLLLEMMGAEAQRLVAEDNPDEAAQMALAAMRLSAQFPLQGATHFIRHQGLAGLRVGQPALEAAIRHPNVTPETLREAEQTLAGLRWPGYGMTLRCQAERGVQAMRNLAADSEEREQVYAALDPERVRQSFEQIQTMQEAYHLDFSVTAGFPSLEAQLAEAAMERRAYDQALADVDAFAAQSSPFIEAVAQNADLPFCRRQRVTFEWASQFTDQLYWTGEAETPSSFLSLCNYFPLTEDLKTIKLLLARALCLARLGEESRISEIIDPFSGQPLQFNADRIWSVGPDQIDQGGEVPLESVPVAESYWEQRIPRGDIVIER